MKNIGVFFGGRSCEHDVSIVTGLQAMEQLDREKYRVYPVYLARDGRWYTGDGLYQTAVFTDFVPNDTILPCRLSQVPEEGLLVSGEDKPLKLHAALLCMHGAHGEDGSLQGLLEMSDIPYTSSGVAGSAAGMDKDMMKKVFLGCGFPIMPYQAYHRNVYLSSPAAVAEEIERKIGYPCYVKPASLGSSIGVTKATTRDGLTTALDLAFSYDRKVVVEQGVEYPMEINCSVLGMEGQGVASCCEKPLGWQEFLTFEDKYLRSGAEKNKKGGGKTGGSTREIPADIPESLSRTIQQLALDVFHALDCRGVVRIDFLVDTQSDELFVNEINTIPGSLAFYLWEPQGMSYPQLLDRLISLAEESLLEKKKNSYAFESVLLANLKNITPGKGGKSGKRF